MELLLVWARRILLEIELPELEKYLKELESQEILDVDLIDIYEDRLKLGIKEYDIVMKAYDEEYELMKTRKISDEWEFEEKQKIPERIDEL